MECFVDTEKKTIGQILVERGVMTPRQVRLVLHEQGCNPARPAFGELARGMFRVPAAELDAAWVRQYLAGDVRIDLNDYPVDETALTAISRRQAWQFQIVPLGYDGEELVLVTCEKWLPRAVRFAQSTLETSDRPVRVVVTEERSFRARLRRCYAWSAMEELLASDRMLRDAKS